MESIKRPRLFAVQAIPAVILELTFVDDRRFTLDMSKNVQACPGLNLLTKGDALV